MNYKMKLNANAFHRVKEGEQKWETRLFDEKRKKIKVGDTITFAKLPNKVEICTAKVAKILTAKNFSELFTKFDPTEATWPRDYSAEDCAKGMEKYYSLEKQEKFGVVAFAIVPQT
ncbi:ASCH domain-containing protein [candidate division WWE3 bacterium]|jgi:ASC-1-like (ASCH) protein|nr:ASCH domain-containing protein [candidate division WWE3 bacterium]MBT7349258.1 ASCH domain-containing protein [candidate division WWE3 bacterium]